MDRQTIRVIEAKVARVRGRLRINPDALVRWGIIAGGLAGAAGVFVWNVANGLFLDAVKFMLAGAFLGGLALGLVGVFVSVLYEVFVFIAERVATFGKSKAGPADNEDV